MNNKRILIIGQLPKEAGGTYTTGIARVVENLYLKDFVGNKVYWYFTNVKQKNATAKSRYLNQFSGFRYLPFKMIWNCMSHPFKTVKEWKEYKKAGINPIRYEFYKANFQFVINKVKPDLIHIHGNGMQPLFFANEKTKTPILITFHGVMYNEEDSCSWHFKPSYLSIIKMADFFTVLNKETKRKALLLGMPENRCYTIPNGVDSSRFYYSDEQRKVIRDGLSDNTKVFITVGAVIDRKGQFDFMRVLEELGTDYQYWIIGKGPDEVRIENYVTKNNLNNKVKLLGYVDGNELYKYLSAADIYAHVSTTEGQALSEIEAYATGMRIIVRKEISGTVIGDAEKDNYTYYILNTNEWRRDSLSSWLNVCNGVRKSRTKYDWAEIANEYSDLYNSLLGKNN